MKKQIRLPMIIVYFVLQILLYKLQRKIKVFHTANPLSNRGYNLVASSSKYGVVFVGSPNGELSGEETLSISVL